MFDKKKQQKFQEDVFLAVREINNDLTYYNIGLQLIEQHIVELATVWNPNWQKYDFLYDHKLIAYLCYTYAYNKNHLESDTPNAIITTTHFKNMLDQIIGAVGEDINWHRVYTITINANPTEITIDYLVQQLPMMSQYHSLQKKFQLF